MGVDLKLIIGETWDHDDHESMMEYLRTTGQSIHEIARVDLCGVNTTIWKLVYRAQAEAAERIAKTGVRFRVLDGMAEKEDGTMVERFAVTDGHDNPLGAIKLSELLPVLKEEFEKSKADYAGKGYRRYELAIAIIEVVLSRFSLKGDDHLIALTWGH